MILTINIPKREREVTNGDIINAIFPNIDTEQIEDIIDVDEQNSSGKLDLIIQLPYMVKSDAKKQQAEERRKMIEDQLVGSKYGIAYMDATEHVTQLNRPYDMSKCRVTYDTDWWNAPYKTESED